MTDYTGITRGTPEHGAALAEIRAELGDAEIAKRSGTLGDWDTYTVLVQVNGVELGPAALGALARLAEALEKQTGDKLTVGGFSGLGIRKRNSAEALEECVLEREFSSRQYAAKQAAKEATA
jgi:hypothetical protein